MKYEISLKYFDFILLDLIDLKDKCSLCDGIDHSTIKLIQELIDVLRYYRQFVVKH